MHQGVSLRDRHTMIMEIPLGGQSSAAFRKHVKMGMLRRDFKIITNMFRMPLIIDSLGVFFAHFIVNTFPARSQALLLVKNKYT